MFQEGETEKRVTLTILDDLLPEDNEELFVYLLPQTEGVRVAQPALNNGRMKVDDNTTIFNTKYQIFTCFMQ